MKHYGNIDLNRNQLQNVVLPNDTNFPTDPIPGMIVFKNKKIYACVEVAAGLPVWVPMTQEIGSYIHTQTSASTAWTITHDLNATSVMVQIYDNAGISLIPDYIDVSVFNQVTVMFSTAQVGKAVITLGNLVGSPKSIIAYSQSFSNLSTWVVPHGLGYFPDIGVYVGGQLVQPLSIVNNSTMQATITFTTPQSGTVRCI